MWDVECHEPSREHVEERARERLLHAARTFQEPLTEEEAKEKILQIMQTDLCKDHLGIDLESRLPKFWATKNLPGSRNIMVKLCIIEDVKNKKRSIKTLLTNFDELRPNKHDSLF